jgi:hypothetical protein
MFCANQQCPDFKRTGTPGEYVDGITSCPFCGAALVEQMPDMIPDIYEDDVEPEYDVDPADADLENDDSDQEDTDESVMKDDSEYVPVAEYDYRKDVDHIVDYLVEEGIDAYESLDEYSTTDPLIGVIKRTLILVPKDQADQAISLLAEMDEEDSE